MEMIVDEESEDDFYLVFLFISLVFGVLFHDYWPFINVDVIEAFHTIIAYLCLSSQGFTNLGA